MRSIKHLSNELTIAIVIGTIPLVVLLKFVPNTTVVTHLSSFTIDDPVIYYFAYLFLIHCAIFAINKYLLFNANDLNNFVSSLHRISYQVGFTIHGVYRVLLGAIPTAIIYLIWEEGFSYTAGLVTVLSLFLAGGSLFMCCFLAFAQEKTAPRAIFFRFDK